MCKSRWNFNSILLPCLSYSADLSAPALSTVVLSVVSSLLCLLQILTMGIQQPDGGRVTVIDDILRVHKSSGDVEEQTLHTPELFWAALLEHFSITPVG